MSNTEPRTTTPAPNPDCPRCRGAGFIHPWDHAENKPAYSTVIPCNEVGCMAGSIRGYRFAGSFLKERGMTVAQTFATWQVVTGAEEAYKAARQFATASGDIFFLLIYGGVGNGKTHLANSVALALNEKSIDTCLYVVADLLAELRQRIKDNTIEERVKWLKELPALILDDFKPEYQSEWASSRVEEIISYRYRTLLLTMMTTNRNLNELPERISSRFLDKDLGRVILNTGPDYRRLKP